MATGGDSGDDRRQSLTCSLCLEIFSQPKLLPCHHTFCLGCLEDLTAPLSSPTMPCPQCRSEVTIPTGGVSAFQSNFYIRPEDLDIARGGTRCLTHPKEDLDLYCVDCQLAVCLKCVLTKHTGHTTQDLSEAAREAKKQLKQHDDRLQKAVSVLTEKVEGQTKEQRNLLNKKAAVESSIRNKYATVVAMATRCRNELLNSMNTACKKMETEVNTTLGTQTVNLEELCQRQQRLRQTLNTGTACSQLAMARELREGRGAARTIDNLTSAGGDTITRPVLNSRVTFDSMMQQVRDFFGTVEAMKMKPTPDEVVVVEEKFTCRGDKDIEVYSLCPRDDGPVWISYVYRKAEENVFSDLFEENGVPKSTSKKASGKTSRKCRNGKTLFLTPSDSEINTYPKSVQPHNNVLKLCNSLQGKADITREQVTSETPFQSKSDKEFTINVGAHRAFDVDTDEDKFVVVEEPRAPDSRRRVKLYRRNKADPLATYCPPSTPFNPSDVCFFTLAGQNVLAIADEAGDSIHVVHVHGGSLTFVRHLAPGCPALIQPTALNVDHRGRLWVACRGGADSHHVPRYTVDSTINRRNQNARGVIYSKTASLIHNVLIQLFPFYS